MSEHETPTLNQVTDMPAPGIPPTAVMPPTEELVGQAGHNRMQRLLGATGLNTIRHGIRGWNRAATPEASYDQPDFAFIASHVEDYVRYYGYENKTTDSQVELAEGTLALMQEDQVWPAIGFAQIPLQKSQKQGSFLKENKPELALSSQYNFRIVTDPSGDEWLLKRAGRSRDASKSVVNISRLQAAQQIADEEAMASNIAAYMGYPVPETTLMTYEDKPWVAYRYVEGALDSRVVEGAHGNLTGAVSNPAAVILRPVFNFIAGSYGDASHQGIVDPATNQYYAQDLAVSSFMPKMEGMNETIDTWDAFLDWSARNPDKLGYLDVPIPKTMDRQTYETLGAYVDRLRDLDPHSAAGVLNPRTPRGKQQINELASAVASRAQALVKLYDKGYFTYTDSSKNVKV